MRHEYNCSMVGWLIDSVRGKKTVREMYAVCMNH